MKKSEIPWEAVARILAPTLAPIVLAVAWIFLARTNKTVDWLSNVFALSELVPGVDLNIPSGVVLGSFYNSAKEIEEVVNQVVTAAKELEKPVKETVKDVLVPDILEETEVQKRKPGESWIDFFERRLKETGLFV